MTPSKTLFCFCIAFIIGVALASMIKIPQIFVWGFLVLGVLSITASFLIHKSNIMVLGFCMCMLVQGIMRFQISEFNIANDKLSALNDKPDKITLTGYIASEPDVRDTSQKLKVKVGQSLVLVTVQRYPEYQYLDKVKVTGKLKTPVVFEDFNYKNYLAKDGIYSVMDFPSVELVSGRHDYTIFTFLYEKILFLKSKLIQSIEANLSPPHSIILEGMVFGNDKNMPAELKDKFNITGLSHVTAVSGSNIVVLISMLMVFFLALGFWRGQAFYVSAIFIFIYIVIIGFPASGVRAAIMGFTALLAQKLGRQNTSSRVLVIAAALMLMQNPLLLRLDVGFQLSFLAALGIIYIKPLIDMLCKPIAKEQFKTLLDMVSVALSAQIITLPIIMYNFGRISLIAPITNVLALPVVEVLTVLGFLLAVFGTFSNILGFIFSIPCYFLLTYFIKVLDIFSQPWAQAMVQPISWVWPVVYYIILAGVIWYFDVSKKPKFLGY